MTIDPKNRSYQLIAKANIKKTLSFDYKKPADDVVNWCHLQLKNKHTVFYKIINPDIAEYDKDFYVQLSFIDDGIIKEVVIGNQYELYRGPEKIGYLIIENIIK